MATSINLQNFVINSVESKEVWDYMVGNGLVNENELYIVHGYTPYKYSARVASIDLFAANWIGDSHPYSQVVKIDGITENSQVDLTPSVEQLVIFYEKDLGFVTENQDGIVTVYAIGQKPENDYTIQVTITEVGA